MWWEQCESKLHGARLPLIPSDCLVATAIFDSMVVSAREQELELMKTFKQYARLRRENNPQLVFKDVHAVPSKGVDFIMLKPLQAKIVEVREDGAVVLDHDVGWHDSQPIFCEGVRLQTIHITPDCLWVEDTTLIQQGSMVSQMRCTATKHGLAEAFLSAWKQTMGTTQHQT